MRRQWTHLLLALTAGLLTATLVWQTLTRERAPLPTPTPEAEASVLVAARDLGARTLLGPEDVTVITLPVRARHPQALTRPEEAIGRVVRYPLTAGEQILAGKLADDRRSASLADIIPPGKRAVAIQVSEVIGVGGLLQPGDKVDILALFDKQTYGKDAAFLLLQNVEVLAVAQTTLTEAEEPAATPLSRLSGPTPTPVPGAPRTLSPPARPTPKPQPQAKTVTVAVTPEEAQRLALAEKTASLRLALRPVGDSTVVELPEATLTTLRAPVEPPLAQITAVRFSPTNARAGDTLKVEITVKNTSTQVLKSQGPHPEFTYVQGQTYHSQNFPSEPGKIRVGVSFEGRPAAPFPYRWGLGGDLPPGATTTVVGFIKLTYDLKPTNFWAGLILEPATVLQDNVGTTLITVVPANVAVIAVDVANVRSGPDLAASVVSQLRYGTEVPILGQEKDWYRVKLPDGREGYVAAGWIIAPQRGG